MGKQQEIIEIGAFRISPVGEFIDQFQSYVKPRFNPNLSAYCTELTGIDQMDINRSKGFDIAGHAFHQWLVKDNNPYLLCCWGEKDIPLLEQDCYTHQMETDWLRPFIDLKKQYHSIRQIKRKQGLAKTLAKEGLDFEGNHHSALDDALNTARLFVKYLDDWRH